MGILLKRLDTAQQLDLGERLVWTNEHGWSAVAQANAVSTTGALIINLATRSGGRPIVLDGKASQAWYPMELCQQLRAWSQVAGLELELTLRSVVYRVLFDHSSGSAFEAEDMVLLANSEYTAPDAPQELLYLPVLKFIELPPL